MLKEIGPAIDVFSCKFSIQYNNICKNYKNYKYLHSLTKELPSYVTDYAKNTKSKFSAFMSLQLSLAQKVVKSICFGGFAVPVYMLASLHCQLD